MAAEKRKGLKWVLRTVLCMVLLWGFVPVTALAEGSFDGTFDLSQYSGKEITITAEGFKVDGGVETAYTGGYTLTGNAKNFSLTIVGGNPVITLKDVSISQGKVFDWGDYGIKVVSGSAILSLEGTNTISTNGGGGSQMPIWVTEGTTLTIKGIGTLNALNGQDGKASIGAAWNYKCGTIFIEGGIINATGGGNGGAVIGESGDNRGNGNITISGGVVNCTMLNTSDGARAISGNSVVITGGIVKGTVKSGATVENCILNGTVYGTVTLTDDYTVAEGETLTIPEGASLIVSEGVKLTISEGAGLADNGTLKNNGIISNAGSVTIAATGSYSGTGKVEGTTIKAQGGDGQLNTEDITADVIITS